MTLTQGVLYVHSAPSALIPHLEWAVGGACGAPVRLDWLRQPAQPGTHRCEYDWTGRAGTGARIASALRDWERLRYEVTEDATPDTEGMRWAWTPDLGMFSAQIGPSGDIVVPEERLRAALATADPSSAIRDLLGDPWDAELEAFRYAGEGAPVRWMHRAV